MKNHNSEDLVNTLAQAGLKPDDINSILDALETVLQLKTTVQSLMPQGGFSTRVYSYEEQEKLDLSCRGFLMGLEQQGILPPELREIVIEHVMQLNDVTFDVPRLRLLILLILSNQSGMDALLTYYEILSSVKDCTMH